MSFDEFGGALMEGIKDKIAEVRMTPQEYADKKHKEYVERAREINPQYAKVILEPKSDNAVRTAWAESGEYDLQGEDVIKDFINRFPGGFQGVNVEAITQPRTLENNLAELRDEGITSADQLARKMHKAEGQMIEELIEVVDGKGETLRDGDGGDTPEKNAIVDGVFSGLREQEALRYSLDNEHQRAGVEPLDTSRLTTEQAEALREYARLSRELMHVAGDVITTTELERRGRELKAELEELGKSLTDVLIKAAPWTDEERRSIEMVKMGVEIGESNGYAWERPDAVYYEMVQVTDKQNGVGPAKNEGDYTLGTSRGDTPIATFNLLFYRDKDTLNWEVVDINGLPVDTPENRRVTVDMFDVENVDQFEAEMERVIYEMQTRGYVVNRNIPLPEISRVQAEKEQSDELKIKSEDDQQKKDAMNLFFNSINIAKMPGTFVMRPVGN